MSTESAIQPYGLPWTPGTQWHQNIFETLKLMWPKLAQMVPLHSSLDEHLPSLPALYRVWTTLSHDLETHQTSTQLKPGTILWLDNLVMADTLGLKNNNNFPCLEHTSCVFCPLSLRCNESSLAEACGWPIWHDYQLNKLLFLANLGKKYPYSELTYTLLLNQHTLDRTSLLDYLTKFNQKAKSKYTWCSTIPGQCLHRHNWLLGDESGKS